YMVKELKAAGVPIHGIGMQGHYHTNTPVHTVTDSLKLFSELSDIEISITELDVTVTGSEKATTLSHEHALLQAQYYAQLFQIYKRYATSIKRVTFWGLDDQSSWRGERFPTIFNKDYSPKAAFHAIIDPEKFLQAHPLVARDTTQVATAQRGTPELGNEKTWLTSKPLAVSRQLTAWEGATAIAYTMWDEENLYVRADVATSETHNKDAIAIYLNAPFATTHHITITLENEVSFNGKAEVPTLKTFVTTTPIGYQVEAKIPFQSGLSARQTMGFDIEVNDFNQEGYRQSAAAWNDVTGSLPYTTENLGSLTLEG
ncbi:MAG: endo-1,4-beta-xylanase, partial [Turicibacter sp.]|nr:endo-1,4-beta-xylanase [Turicibacter sp.]